MEKWTELEDNYLIENYNSKLFIDIAQYFKGRRSVDAIRRRAKDLRLTRSKSKEWSIEEIEMLLSDLPEKLISHKTGRTLSAIRKKRALERAKKNSDIDFSKIFDLSAIENGVPNIKVNSKSSQYFALLSSMDIGQSFEFPEIESSLVRNQIYLLPDRKFQTRKWSDTSRRVWLINIK